MKNFNLPLSVLFLLLTHNVFSQGFTWTQCADFGGGIRYSPFGFSIGNKGYIGGGVIITGSNYNYNFHDFWEYDPQTDIWTQKATFPGAGRNGSTGFSIGSKGYVCLGWTPNQVNDLWEYDPASNAWAQKTNFGGAARYDAASFVLSGFAYVGMGYIPWSKDFWKYDPVADSWTQIADIGGSARQCGAGFALNGYGYVYGGSEQFNNYTNALWQYNPSSNTWTSKAPMPGIARTSPFSFAINGKGYIGTGANISTVYQDFYEYDPVTDSWTQVQDFGGGIRMQGVSFNIGNCGYAGCGSPSIYPNIVAQQDVWSFCNTTGINEGSENTSEIKVTSDKSSLYFQFSKPIEKKSQLKVYDTAGHTIASEVVKVNQEKLSVNFNGMAKGIYYYMLFTADGKIKSGKFIFS